MNNFLNDLSNLTIITFVLVAIAGSLIAFFQSDIPASFYVAGAVITLVGGAILIVQ